MWHLPRHMFITCPKFLEFLKLFSATNLLPSGLMEVQA
jgi:hypothetical protein